MSAPASPGWTRTSPAILRSGGKPVILAGNKADSSTDPYYAHELYRLGLGEPRLISALSGTDTGDLLDEVLERLPPSEGAVEERVDELRVAIIGRPNVGKSSLLNYLVGEERALVSPVAGTTRDAVDTVVDHHGRQVRLVDTAGIRRRGVVSTDIEHYSLLRAMRALERSDVALVVVDSSEGIVAQDRHIAGYAAEAGKGVVVIANKWDLVPQEDRADPETLTKIGAAFDFVPGVPVMTLSALQGRNVAKVLDTAAPVADGRATRMPTPALNQLVREAVASRPAGDAPGPPAQDPLRHPGELSQPDRGPLRQRPRAAPLLVRALPGEPHPRRLRLRRGAAPHGGPAPERTRGLSFRHAAPANDNRRDAVATTAPGGRMCPIHVGRAPSSPHRGGSAARG